MKYLKLIYVGVLISMALACSSDDSNNNDEDSDNSNEISNEPFSGVINQSSYLYKYAFGELQLDDDGNEELKFYVSDIEFDCNSDFNDISFDIRGTVSASQLGFQIATIATNTGIGIANQTGEIVDLVSITDDEAVIKVRTDGENYTLEGKFTVTICPDLETVETN